MKSLLVTGGAGFIGSHLADAAIAAGYRTVVFDNLSTGTKSFVPRAAVFVRGDIRKPADVASVFRKFRFDAVFHVAGQASQTAAFADPTYDNRENVEGTIHVVDACVTYRVQRFIYASSMTVYGHPKTMPVSEEHMTSPISYYGISKLAAERYVLSTGLRRDIAAPFYPTSLRMFNIYGPRQSLSNPYQGVMAIFLGRILRNEPVIVYGDGKQSRDFLHIDDAVRAWMAALSRKESYHRAINLGAGKRISVNSVIRQLIAHCGKDPHTYPVSYKPARPGEQRHMEADMSLAKKALAFIPTIPLSAGLDTTIAWAKMQV
jgi:UDP-glucose 4-epimerase